MELARCVLENNVFEHNGEIFKQKQGTTTHTATTADYSYSRLTF